MAALPPPDAGRLDVGEEVGRLTEALAGWWTSTATGPSPQGTGSAGARPDGTTDGAPHDSASCRACPLCRAVDVARAARPELLEKVALAAETVALLLREAAGDRRGEPPDAWASAVDTDLAGGGTPVVVTDEKATSTTGDAQEEGRAAWG